MSLGPMETGSRGDAETQSGKTNSAEAMLEQLRVNNGAVSAWLSPPTESMPNWFAFIAWEKPHGHQARGDHPAFVIEALTRIGGMSVDGGSAWQAVEALAANIPGRRERIRADITELQQRLRALAKTI